MRNHFRITGASVPGSDHTQVGKPFWKNDQDAYFLCQDEFFTIGIVADGCGSGESSEVGAKIGVRLLAKEIADSLNRESPSFEPAIPWRSIACRLDSRIFDLSNAMGGKMAKTVEEHFLFSFVGFVVTPLKTTLFHCGDGSYAVNGRVTNLGPFPNNAPPYFAYRTLRMDPGLEIATVEFDTSEIESVAVATDGTDCFADYPSTLGEWLSTDAVFNNPDALRRRLAVMNRERIVNGLLVPGPLKDDTTLAIARRKVASSDEDPI